MGKLLETIVIEINPLHDFDDIRFYNHMNTTSLAKKAKAQLKNLYFFLTLAKPLVRGCVIGGTIGTIGSLTSGNSPGEGVAHGVVIGGYLDFWQYMARGLYHYAREQFYSSG